MKRSNYVLFASASLFLLSSVQLLRSRSHSVKAAPAEPRTFSSQGLITAPGRVEAVSEEIRVSSELSGRLESVPVEEGDRIHKGQVLARLENKDYAARVLAAEATLSERKAELLRTVNGARLQERRAARAALEAHPAAVARERNRVTLNAPNMTVRHRSFRWSMRMPGRKIVAGPRLPSLPPKLSLPKPVRTLRKRTCAPRLTASSCANSGTPGRASRHSLILRSSPSPMIPCFECASMWTKPT